MRTRVMRMGWIGVAGAGLGVLLVGCSGSPSKSSDSPDAVVANAKPTPTYEEIAARYNERAARLERLWARAVVRLTYADEKGDRHTDQGEGVLQMIRPDRVGLSIKKAGKMLFWLGCDAERYWFFDVVDEKIGRVGRNPKEGVLSAGGNATGIGIPPRELFELIGMTTLDASAKGSVAWSKDGEQLVVTIVKQSRGEVVGGETALWLSPASFEPTRIERRDARGRVIISSALADYEGVEIEGQGGLKPRLATKLDAMHAPSGTQIRLDLSELRDSDIGEGAFVFETLRKSLGVETLIDIDEEARRAPTTREETKPALPVDQPPREAAKDAVKDTAKPAPPKSSAPIRGTPITPKKPAGKP